MRELVPLEKNSIEQYPIYMERWGFELIVIHTNVGPFYPIGILCAAIGIKDAKQQREKLQSHYVLSRLILQLPVQFKKGGTQDTWCIHKKGIGHWWGSLDVTKLRPEIKENLIDLQWDIVDADDKVLFGEVEASVSSPVYQMQSEIRKLQTDVAGLTHLNLILDKRLGRIERRSPPSVDLLTDEFSEHD